jgi:2-(1,2-epoxy-1,2-dihydrophenyl)acetyl-CoA isomerase
MMNLMERKATRYYVKNQIATLELFRPDSKNALDMVMRKEISEIINEVREDEDIKVLIITGNGGNFCAGGDIKSLSQGFSPKEGRKRVQKLHDWFFDLVNLEKPVIAAVDGFAVGAGFNLALACDFIFASDRANFSQIFGRIGLVPDLGGFFLLPRIVGLSKAKELMFTARMIKADEAKELNIVYEIYPSESLLSEANKFAERFLNASTDSIGITKMILNQSFNLDQRALWEMEALAQALSFESPYYREMTERFINKQKLPFNWEKY